MHNSDSHPGRTEAVALLGYKALTFLRKAGLIALASLWVIFVIPSAYSATATVTQTLNAQLNAIGKVQVPASISLTSGGSVFNSYTGSLTINYRARSTAGGSGSITVQATAEFSPAGGPTVASNLLTYTCSGATLGTACSGTLTVSLASATSVLTIPASSCTGGGGSCSAADPNTVSTNLSLGNLTTYKTGSYTASLTFTISAT